MFHLAKRFFGHVTARPLSPAEQAVVTSHLDVRLRRLFYAQPMPDQRHAFEVASRYGFDRPHVEAALLHDVGKTGSALGPVARSAATVWGSTSLPVWGRWHHYLDHGRIGAATLAAAGANEVTIAFARSHPGPPPPSVASEEWHALSCADEI